MQALRTTLLIGFTVLGMAAAQAQDKAPAAGQHGMPDRAQMQAKMADMFAKRQARLHDLLKLTAQQESAWATYQAAIKPAAGDRAWPEHGAAAKLTAPERLSKMLEHHKQRQAKMEAHLAALNTFYGQLSSEQKAVFDDHTMGGAHGGHPMQRRARGGWGEHHAETAK
ncbi:Spy/CpxP family protein refolding chaperone [Duganella qianjiadongensis]|uniref:LTXXQ motif family protein n=1 Tax=Duganella qianjiadongensis TaxID=2692176 RepID=A0ABW9VPW7_9BURK|nr:Spy/CpxP family protein refolding chaperone [Duganella qianjiadongensis]MYM41614.1 hypothetical protein [Duganella qianjiadongensis]